MRHTRFLYSTADASANRATHTRFGSTPQLGGYNLPGPSTLPLPTTTTTTTTTTTAETWSSLANNPRMLVKQHRPLSFLYPPSCRAFDSGDTCVGESAFNATRSNSSFAPTTTLSSAVAVSTTTAAATHDPPPISLLTLRQQSSAFRQSLQASQTVHVDTIVSTCKRLVLLASRIRAASHARSAHAIVCQTVAECAVHLSDRGHVVVAANIVRHVLVNIAWNPTSVDALNPSPPSREHVVAHAVETLGVVAQQLISRLSLASNGGGGRQTRRFESSANFEAVQALVAAMRGGDVVRWTRSQTALIRAMVASGYVLLAVRAFAVEVTAWWAAHNQAKRSPCPASTNAAIVVEWGKPSSQGLREVVRGLQQLQAVLLRITPHGLAELSHSECVALCAKRHEYAESLVELIRLVRAGRLPIPPTPCAPEITWILSACCRFESTTLLDHPVAMNASIPGCFDAQHKRSLQHAAQVIRYYMREYMQSLPDGQSRSGANLLIAANPVIRPAIGIAVYNQLIHYSLAVLKSPSMCKHIFQHMTHIRHPPLEPDAVTLNTILRQATTQRYASLARAVLTTTKPNQPTPIHVQTIASESHTFQPMIQHIDTAIAHADSYRLVSLLQYVTSCGLFLRRYRNEPGHVGVKELVMRIYPTLNTQRFSRKQPPPHVSHSHTSFEPTRLRPKANRASRHAILNPHVLTATLNLAAKAGKTGLALRIWRLIKRTSVQSSLRSVVNDVASEQWKVPVEAATLVMQVLATEAARVPRVRLGVQERGEGSVGLSGGMSRRWLRCRAQREYARGWNIVASLRGRSRTSRLRKVGRGYDRSQDLGEGLRWRAAQLLAKREYAFLVHHWQLSHSLSKWRRKRLQDWLQPRQNHNAAAVLSKTRGLGVEERRGLQPDSRFYDALLAVVSRRAGMVQRSRRHVSPSEVLRQLRKGYVEAVSKAQNATTRTQAENASKLDDRPPEVESALQGGVVSSSSSSETNPAWHTMSTNQMIHAVVSRIHFNSRGRWTSLTPDRFLVHILLDMEALALEIPIAYRWILTHCSIATASDSSIPPLLQNHPHPKPKNVVGAFSPFRGPRIKTVGLIARRPNSTAATKPQTDPH